MKSKLLKALACLLALVCLAGCGAIAPKEKTIILSEDTVKQQQEDSDPAAQSFEVKKIVKLPMDKLNPTGNHPDVNKAVVGWIDNDNLAAMTVQTVSVGTDTYEETETVQQPTERVMTQFVRIHAQYGFYDPILTLVDVEAECFDISADGSLAAYVAGNRLDVYSLHSGSLVQTLTREILASRVTFAQDGHEVYFTAAGEDKQLEMLDADSGSAATVLADKTYRALAAGEGGMVVCTQSDGAEALGYYDGSTFREALLSMESRTNSCHVLKNGKGLAAYGGDLYLLDEKGVSLAGADVLAFDLCPDEMYVAYAQRNADGTVDIRTGYWSGSRIINDKLTYKDIGVTVNAMYFSPDLSKLYLQGRDEGGQLTAYTFEFR